MSSSSRRGSKSNVHKLDWIVSIYHRPLTQVPNIITIATQTTKAFNCTQISIDTHRRRETRRIPVTYLIYCLSRRKKKSDWLISSSVVYEFCVCKCRVHSINGNAVIVAFARARVVCFTLSGLILAFLISDACVDSIYTRCFNIDGLAIDGKCLYATFPCLAARNGFQSLSCFVFTYTDVQLDPLASDSPEMRRLSCLVNQFVARIRLSKASHSNKLNHPAGRLSKHPVRVHRPIRRHFFHLFIAYVLFCYKLYSAIHFKSRTAEIVSYISLS